MASGGPAMMLGGKYSSKEATWSKTVLSAMFYSCVCYTWPEFSRSSCSTTVQLSWTCVVHTHTFYISPYTGKHTSWVCVLGWLTVTQEVWPTQTNMKFSGAGHASSHSESHHYNVVRYSHHLLTHARCYLCCLKLLYVGKHAYPRSMS